MGRFQSPSGDSLFSDQSFERLIEAGVDEEFQSPSGDSLFSDFISISLCISFCLSFQSPSGDSLFSDILPAVSIARIPA